MYLGLELLALSLYALVAFDRDRRVAAEAAMKYFVLGALASGMLLYGMSMIYGATGTLELDELAARVATSARHRSALLLRPRVRRRRRRVQVRRGAVPHVAAGRLPRRADAVTLFIGSAPKIASFALALRLLAEGARRAARRDWQHMLIVLAVLSLVVGNIVAIAQTNLKRMLAYSTISHIGFILLGFVAGTPSGYSAALFYTSPTCSWRSAAFGMIMLLSRAGFEAEQLERLQGPERAQTRGSRCIMLMLMFSLAGVPPFVGFWASSCVLGACVERGPVWLAGGRRGVRGDRRVLLPARRQAHVLRRAHRSRRRSRPRPTCESLSARTGSGCSRSACSRVS